MTSPKDTEPMPLRVWPAPSLARRLAAEECAALGIPGIHPSIVFTRDRTKIASWLKAKVSQRLLESGRYSITGIGHVLGMDHSTIIHHSRRDLSIPPTARRLMSKRQANTQSVRILAYLNSVSPACVTYDDMVSDLQIHRSCLRQHMSSLRRRGDAIRVCDGISRVAWRAP